MQLTILTALNKAIVQPYSTAVVVDDCFMKKGFLEVLTTEGFHVVTKGRRDA